MNYATARAALDRIAGDLDEDDFEALDDMVELFKPYAGDDPEVARTRNSAPCTCQNCGFTSRQMFAPADLMVVARASIRLAKCPRCFSTSLAIGATGAPDPL